jgi:hypothetical protein
VCVDNVRFHFGTSFRFGRLAGHLAGHGHGGARPRERTKGKRLKQHLAREIPSRRFSAQVTSKKCRPPLFNYRARN